MYCFDSDLTQAKDNQDSMIYTEKHISFEHHLSVSVPCKGVFEREFLLKYKRWFNTVTLFTMGPMMTWSMHTLDPETACESISTLDREQFVQDAIMLTKDGIFGEYYPNSGLEIGVSSKKYTLIGKELVSCNKGSGYSAAFMIKVRHGNPVAQYADILDGSPQNYTKLKVAANYHINK